MTERSRTATSTRHALASAQRAGAKVELTPVNGSGRALTSTIEEVGDDSFVIGLPAIAGAARPLAKFGTYTVTFVGPGGVLTGQTRALGRTKVRGTSGQMTPGYRMELPSALHAEDRRRELRAVLGPDSTREGQLRVLDRTSGIHGAVHDISSGGAQLKCRNAPDDLQEGQRGLFTIDLPDPVGAVEELVTILSIDRDHDSGTTFVRVRFRQKNEAIAAAMGDRKRAG